MNGTDVPFSLISHVLQIIDNLLRQVARHSSKLASSGNATACMHPCFEASRMRCLWLAARERGRQRCKCIEAEAFAVFRFVFQCYCCRPTLSHVPCRSSYPSPQFPVRILRSRYNHAVRTPAAAALPSPRICGTPLLRTQMPVPLPYSSSDVRTSSYEAVGSSPRTQVGAYGGKLGTPSQLTGTNAFEIYYYYYYP